MQRNGQEFGAHTITHPRLSLLDKDELIKEVFLRIYGLEFK